MQAFLLMHVQPQWPKHPYDDCLRRFQAAAALITGLAVKQSELVMNGRNHGWYCRIRTSSAFRRCNIWDQPTCETL